MMKTGRRSFIRTAGLGAAGLAVPVFLPSCRLKQKRPNILFIMSDDHAAQAISCFGSPLIRTPHIDRIAQEGILFKNSFVTNSICAPSRAVMLTGRYSHVNGLRDNRDEFDGSQETFPKLLRRAGYETFLAGKWHLKTDPTGFDRWEVLVDQGEYYNPVFIENGVERRTAGYVTDLITDKAINMLQQRDRKKPFCLLMHHKAPHRNWMPSLKHIGAFDSADLPVPETFFDDYAGRPAAAKADMRIADMFLSYDLKLGRGYYGKETGTGGSAPFAANAEDAWQRELERLNPDQRKAWDARISLISESFRRSRPSGRDLLEWKYRRYLQDYLACILSVDESVGRMLDTLDQSGLADDTIVIYTSDQGFYLGEHGWYDKRFMYEESLRMPLLLRYPREAGGGRTCTEMVLNLDFAPTLLDFAGVDIPAGMQGRSLRDLIRGIQPGDWRNSLYYHYYEYPHGWHSVMRHHGIRTESYKLIHFYDDADYWELYDLEKDTHEIRNLAGDPACAGIVSDLKKAMKKLQLKFGDRDAPLDY
jgi:arylsulfatase A-like enzyme